MNTVNIPVPQVAPFGIEVTAPMVQDVWDTFIKPDQDAGNIQSSETRVLMAILRAVHHGLSTPTEPAVSNSELVREFHEKFSHPVAPSPTLVDDELADLRIELIQEEVSELIDALESMDIVEVADALGDILYVTYGAALVHGIPIDAVMAEIHRSNMSKLGADGLPVYREDGKILKGPNYSPPVIGPILDCARVEAAQ